MHVELSDIIGALEADEIVPFFQPIVTLRTGQIAGFEVLARWHHPIHGPILPFNFISLAEKNGLIGTLMNQVLRKAFGAASAIPPPLTLSINVSPIQMHFMTLPAQIQAVADEFDFSLDRLTIEITESALLYDLDRAQDIAARLRELGCRLSLDDFGTGFSSLRHLNVLPFHELKIDRSFISSVLNDRESRKIVGAVTGLAHSLHLDAVGEGIEDKDHAQILVLLDCKFGQGYFYGRPAPAESLPQMINAPAFATSVPDTQALGGAFSALESMPAQRLPHLQAIYDGAPVGLSFLDPNFRYLSLNQRLAEMNRLPVEDHLGKAVSELFPHWFPAVEPHLRRALAGEPVGGVQIWKPGPNPGDHGSFVLASYQPVRDEAGEVIGISISVLDVTEHMRVKDKVALKGPFDTAESDRSELWIMDPSGLPLKNGAAWPPTTGIANNGRNQPQWLESVHPDDLAKTTTIVREAMRTGNPIDVAYRVRCMPEGWRHVRVQGSAHFGPVGESTRWYGNITEVESTNRAGAA